jgi:hypothetical protein
MTVMDATTDASAGQPTPSEPTHPARRRGRRRIDLDGPVPLEVQTIKEYRIDDDARRTVGYLRRIVNQRRIPDDARLTIEGDRITIEWADQ